MVVDFAVEGHHVAAGRGQHGLVPFGGKVDDGEAAKTESDACLRIDPTPLIIGAAVTQRIGHARHRVVEHCARRRSGQIKKTS